MLKSPGSGVLLKCTDGGVGEGVLGGILVIRHSGVLKPFLFSIWENIYGAQTFLKNVFWENI